MKQPPWAVFVRLVFSEFVKNQCLQRASAMAYATLLALVPCITLSFSLFTHFVELSNIKRKIQDAILAHFLPQTGNHVFDSISVHLDHFVSNAATINALGVLGLALTSVSLFTTVENSFNDVWKVEKQRSFFARYNAFCGMLIGMPLLIGGSLYLSSAFNIASLWRTFPFAEKMAYTVLPLLLTWAAFILLYHQVPFTKVHWGAAVLGGIVAGTFWEMAKFGFGIYVSKAVNISLIYGSLGSMLLFLVWLYFTWVIVLLGVQISYVVQNLKVLATGQ